MACPARRRHATSSHAETDFVSACASQYDLAMVITLRPTYLSRDPNAQDWSIYEDGTEIGRLYQDKTASRAENLWFWSITATEGRAPALEQAKADFRVAWTAFKGIAEVEDDSKKEAPRRVMSAGLVLREGKRSTNSSLLGFHEAGRIDRSTAPFPCNARSAASLFAFLCKK
jgi:hypothetical protein